LFRGTYKRYPTGSIVGARNRGKHFQIRASSTATANERAQGTSQAAGRPDTRLERDFGRVMLLEIGLTAAARRLNDVRTYGRSDSDEAALVAQSAISSR
jgi:hypothetical protein